MVTPPQPTFPQVKKAQTESTVTECVEEPKLVVSFVNTPSECLLWTNFNWGGFPSVRLPNPPRFFHLMTRKWTVLIVVILEGSLRGSRETKRSLASS